VRNRRKFTYLLITALSGCTALRSEGEKGRAGTAEKDERTETPMGTPIRKRNTESPPPTDSSLEDLKVRNRQNESIAGSIVIEISDSEEQFSFELEGFDQTSWSDVPVMQNQATVVTEIGDRRKKNDWSGSREAGLVITIREDEIEYQRIIS
jgi:hypothetical protein